MAVRSVDAQAGASLSVGVAPTGVESSSRYVFQVFADTTDDVIAVFNGCGYLIGMPNPADARQFLTEIDVNFKQQSTSGLGTTGTLHQWELRLTYSAWNAAEMGDPAQAGNPFAIPARPRIEYEKRPIPIWQDINGNAIVNTAGEFFDPPVEVDLLTAIITVERNERASFDFATVGALAGCVNNAPWNGYDTKTVRVAPIALPQIQYSQSADVFFYPITYVFEWNPLGWIRRPLNTGYNERSPTQINQKRLLPIMDEAGQYLSSPGLLDETGKHLPPPVAQGAAITLAYEVHQPIDFSVFNMDGLFNPGGGS